VSDLAVGGLAIALTSQLPGNAKSIRSELLGELAAIAISLGLLGLFGSYQRAVVWSREVPALLAATVIGFSAGKALAGMITAESRAGALFSAVWFLTFVSLLVVRLLRYRFASERFQQLPLRVVILGLTESAKGLYSALTNHSRDRLDNGGLRIAAIFADGLKEWPEATSLDVVVSETQWTKSFVECCGIQFGIVAIPSTCDAKTVELVDKSSRIFKHLLVAPQIAPAEVAATLVMGDRPNLEILVGDCVAPRGVNVLKRVVDLTGALALGVLALPFVLLVALAIRLTSKGPILYKQLRVGKGNRAFFALKFRTMFVDSRERLTHYLEKDPLLRAEWESVHKLKDDPRVTSIGRLLRRFSLDELPQIWNVVEGDMSLVGPRPIVVSEIQKYGLDYAAYERVRPGLTGLWQVSGRNDTTYQQRVDYDSYYVRNWSLGLDAWIMAKTFRAVISGVGAY
jgi:Undecaprenyl-phosphate galactose phosphotransferase WbaP